jgi:hypothetical protein
MATPLSSFMLPRVSLSPMSGRKGGMINKTLLVVGGYRTEATLSTYYEKAI